MRENTEQVVQFHSLIDPRIPVEEGTFVPEKLKSEYVGLEDVGHFIIEQIFEVVKIIEDKCSR